jgi:hypothetical protein
MKGIVPSESRFGSQERAKTCSPSGRMKPTDPPLATASMRISLNPSKIRGEAFLIFCAAEIRTRTVIPARIIPRLHRRSPSDAVENRTEDPDAASTCTLRIAIVCADSGPGPTCRTRRRGSGLHYPRRAGDCLLQAIVTPENLLSHGKGRRSKYSQLSRGIGNCLELLIGHGCSRPGDDVVRGFTKRPQNCSMQIAVLGQLLSDGRTTADSAAELDV